MAMVTLFWGLLLERHKSRLVLVLELLYSGCLIGLNVGMLFKYGYFGDDEEKREEVELVLKLVVYSMIILLVMRFLTDVKNACCDCECRSRSIVPEHYARKKGGEENK